MYFHETGIIRKIAPEVLVTNVKSILKELRKLNILVKRFGTTFLPKDEKLRLEAEKANALGWMCWNRSIKSDLCANSSTFFAIGSVRTEDAQKFKDILKKVIEANGMNDYYTFAREDREIFFNSLTKEEQTKWDELYKAKEKVRIEKRVKKSKLREKALKAAQKVDPSIKQAFFQPMI